MRKRLKIRSRSLKIASSLQVSRDPAVATAPENAPEAASKDAASVPAPSIFRRNAPLLRRVGVETEQTVSLSLDDAIRKALQNNNDIEVSKKNVKKACK